LHRPRAVKKVSFEVSISVSQSGQVSRGSILFQKSRGRRGVTHGYQSHLRVLVQTSPKKESVMAEDVKKFYTLIDLGVSRRSALKAAGFKFRTEQAYKQKGYELVRDRQSNEAQPETPEAVRGTEPRQTASSDTLSQVLAALAPHHREAWHKHIGTYNRDALLAAANGRPLSGPMVTTDSLTDLLDDLHCIDHMPPDLALEYKHAHPPSGAAGKRARAWWDEVIQGTRKPEPFHPGRAPLDGLGRTQATGAALLSCRVCPLQHPIPT
jgi:hypothetical protein